MGTSFYTRAALGAAIGAGLAATSASGATLLWEESNDNLAVNAANGLGLAPTIVTSESAFTTALPSQSWNLIVVDQPANTISPATATSLANYIAGGGRVLLTYWDMDGNFDANSAISAATMRTSFGVAAVTDLTAAATVSRWVPGHPIFNTPNPIGPSIVPDGTDPWLDDGDRFTTAVGATALAGFTAAPTAGQAAIVSFNGGRTLINGFMGDEMDPIPTQALLANEMASLIPEPSACALAGVAGVALLRRRRRVG